MNEEDMEKILAFSENEDWFFQGHCDQYGRSRLAKKLSLRKGELKEILKGIKKIKSLALPFGPVSMGIYKKFYQRNIAGKIKGN